MRATDALRRLLQLSRQHQDLTTTLAAHTADTALLPPDLLALVRTALTDLEDRCQRYQAPLEALLEAQEVRI